jgi:hypothetical protein
MYQIASDEVDGAMQRYLRVPNKKEHDQQRSQVNDEVHAFRKKFHQVFESWKRGRIRFFSFFEIVFLVVFEDFVGLFHELECAAAQAKVHVHRADALVHAESQAVLQDGLRDVQRELFVHN